MLTKCCTKLIYSKNNAGMLLRQMRSNYLTFKKRYLPACLNSSLAFSMAADVNFAPLSN